MKIVCAWCRQEGREALLGECEPLDDPSETHGICARHAEKVIEQLPSASFPGIRVLFVVRRAETALYEQLKRSFAGLADVAVILDRRLAARRRTARGVGVERRRTTRRVRKALFSALGYYVVRFGATHEGRLITEQMKKLRIVPRPRRPPEEREA